ncbi:MAG: hypothetical protein ACYDBQ_05740 [Thermoplasmatota archaeon]
MADPLPKPGYTKIMEMWMASDLKVQVLVFFHDNPGVIETVEGLARRLGVPLEDLEKEIQGQVALGLLQERQADRMKVLVFDRKREAELQKAIADEVRAIAKRAPA